MLVPGVAETLAGAEKAEFEVKSEAINACYSAVK
jgi:hypothetical protein